MDTESAILNVLKDGADDGRKTANGTKKGVQMTAKEAIDAISMASTYNGCGKYTRDELDTAKKMAYAALLCYPRSGKWLDIFRGLNFFAATCSVCHQRSDIPPIAVAKYCPRCGAKMDLEG